jgi:hypothetical protein
VPIDADTARPMRDRPFISASPVGTRRESIRPMVVSPMVVKALPLNGDGSASSHSLITSILSDLLGEWGDRPVTIRFRRGGKIMERMLVMRWRIDHLEIDPDASQSAQRIRKEMLGF